MAATLPEPVGSVRAGLGEGPVWDAMGNRLIWIDIRLCRLYATDWTTGETTWRDLPGSPGCAALTRHGGVVLAIGQELLMLPGTDPDAGTGTDSGTGTDIGTGSMPVLAALPAHSTGRFNDGKPDAAGRFWVGTATAEGHFDCALWRFDPGGGFTRAVPGVAMSNGLGWSPDGALMYYVDTMTHRVDVLDYDAQTGAVAGRRPWATFADDQLPDGLCVDADGCVWLAVWGQSCVLRLTPDGVTAGRIELPTPLVTSCAFGGPDYRTLFITTASEDGGDPLAGRLFAVDAGTRGRPPDRIGLTD